MMAPALRGHCDFHAAQRRIIQQYGSETPSHHPLVQVFRFLSLRSVSSRSADGDGEPNTCRAGSSGSCGTARRAGTVGSLGGGGTLETRRAAGTIEALRARGGRAEGNGEDSPANTGGGGTEVQLATAEPCARCVASACFMRSRDWGAKLCTRIATALCRFWCAAEHLATTPSPPTRSVPSISTSSKVTSAPSG